MAIDIGWAISISLIGIGITTVLLAVINLKLKCPNQNNTKTNGVVDE
jgi:mannose/fructose/N-acetylgalactosamine-specific phosphotransferase system component IIC